MAMRRLRLLAGLVLTVIALSPAGASAKAGGADRPVTGSASGTDSFNVEGLDFTADFTGVASHIGNYTGHFEGTAVITRVVAASGPFSLVAANGDLLTGTFTLAESLPGGTVHPVTIALTITGGTGRFAETSGTVAMTLQASPFSLDQGILREPVEGPITGKISY